jgi:hypothetical protein
MKKASLTTKVENNDSRGTVLSGKLNGKERFLIAEIKKGKKRGGHYHNVDTYHFALVGKIRYLEKQLGKKGEELNKKETKKTLPECTGVVTPAYSAHLLEALEDSVIIEPSGKGKTTTTYLPYRKLIG